MEGGGGVGCGWCGNVTSESERLLEEIWAGDGEMGTVIVVRQRELCYLIVISSPLSVLQTLAVLMPKNKRNYM